MPTTVRSMEGLGLEIKLNLLQSGRQLERCYKTCDAARYRAKEHKLGQTWWPVHRWRIPTQEHAEEHSKAASKSSHNGADKQTFRPNKGNAKQAFAEEIKKQSCKKRRRLPDRVSEQSSKPERWVRQLCEVARLQNYDQITDRRSKNGKERKRPKYAEVPFLISHRWGMDRCGAPDTVPTEHGAACFAFRSASSDVRTAIRTEEHRA